MKNRKKLTRALFAIAAILIVLFPSIKREIIDIKVKRAIPLARYFERMDVKRYSIRDGKEYVHGNDRGISGTDAIYIITHGETDVVLLEPVARINEKDLTPFAKKFGLDMYTEEQRKNPSNGKTLLIDFYLLLGELPEDFQYKEALLDYCGRQYLPCISGTVYKADAAYYTAVFDWIKTCLEHDSLWRPIFG